VAGGNKHGEKQNQHSQKRRGKFPETPRRPGARGGEDRKRKETQRKASKKKNEMGEGQKSNRLTTSRGEIAATNKKKLEEGFTGKKINGKKMGTEIDRDARTVRNGNFASPGKKGRKICENRGRRSIQEAPSIVSTRSGDKLRGRGRPGICKLRGRAKTGW